VKDLDTRAELKRTGLAWSAAAAWHHSKIRKESIERSVRFHGCKRESRRWKAGGDHDGFYGKRNGISAIRSLEASPGIEPGCKDLQSSA
jgi:hypothetical protein